MATLNLILDTRRQKRDGSYPLVFRIRQGKDFKDIASGFSTLKEKFDFKTNSLIKDDFSNNNIEELRHHYFSRLKTFQLMNIGKENLNLTEIKEFLLNKVPDEISIIQLWNKEIDTLNQLNRIGNARTHKTSLSVISQEMNLDIPFRKLGYQDLINLETSLYKRGMSINGIGVYMRSFRTICNKAINLDYVNLNWYPFRKYKIKKGKTTPRVMSIEELTSYFKLDLSPENPLYKAWLIGKLIFLLRGINLKDLLLLKPSNIVQGRIVYKRAKTGKLYSIEIHSGIQEILDLFQANETLLGVFTNEEINNKIRPLEILTQKRKVVNNHLKKIGKLINSSEEITTYVFRYSYANTAKKLGYSKDLIAEALGHEYGNTVTGIYLEMFDNEMLDEMNICIFKQVCLN